MRGEGRGEMQGVSRERKERRDEGRNGGERWRRLRLIL